MCLWRWGPTVTRVITFLFLSMRCPYSLLLPFAGRTFMCNYRPTCATYCDLDRLPSVLWSSPATHSYSATKKRWVCWCGSSPSAAPSQGKSLSTSSPIEHSSHRNTKRSHPRPRLERFPSGLGMVLPLPGRDIMFSVLLLGS